MNFISVTDDGHSQYYLYMIHNSFFDLSLLLQMNNKAVRILLNPTVFFFLKNQQQTKKHHIPHSQINRTNSIQFTQTCYTSDYHCHIIDSYMTKEQKSVKNPWGYYLLSLKCFQFRFQGERRLNKNISVEKVKLCLFN